MKIVKTKELFFYSCFLFIKRDARIKYNTANPLLANSLILDIYNP